MSTEKPPTKRKPRGGQRRKYTAEQIAAGIGQSSPDLKWIAPPIMSKCEMRIFWQNKNKEAKL
jgi:hypothetical protein